MLERIKKIVQVATSSRNIQSILFLLLVSAAYIFIPGVKAFFTPLTLFGMGGKLLWTILTESFVTA